MGRRELIHGPSETVSPVLVPGGRTGGFFGWGMPSTGSTDLVDTLLLAPIAIVVAGGVFIVVLDGWRCWSDNRRIRKHLRK